MHAIAQRFVISNICKNYVLKENMKKNGIEHDYPACTIEASIIELIDWARSIM